MTIITKDPDSIICDIKEELNKTCTIINSSGVIAGENKTLICYVNYFELQKVKEIISRNKGSFSTVSTIAIRLYNKRWVFLRKNVILYKDEEKTKEKNYESIRKIRISFHT